MCFIGLKLYLIVAVKLYANSDLPIQSTTSARSRKHLDIANRFKLKENKYGGAMKIIFTSF